MANSNEPTGGVLTFNIVKSEDPDVEQPWHWQAEYPNHEIGCHGEGHPTAPAAERALNTFLSYVVSGRFQTVLPQVPAEG